MNLYIFFSAFKFMRKRQRVVLCFSIFMLLALAPCFMIHLLLTRQSQAEVTILQKNSNIPVKMSPASDAIWQIVGETKHKFLVYSAFYENRRVEQIRIIGATTIDDAERVWCRYWFPDRSVAVPGHVKIIREHWNLKYSACFIKCPMIKNLTIPQSVSIMAHPYAAPRNVLRVLQMQGPDASGKVSLLVCVKPIHNNYNRYLDIIEFIELNKILGGVHFIMYNRTVGPQVDCVLKYYQNKGLLTLLPWNLDMVSDVEIWNEGITASLNDCLYRSMYRYAYTAFLDLDEYIIPRQYETLPKLLSYLSAKWFSLTFKKIGAFSFQNGFFIVDWESETYPALDLNISIVTQRKTRRKVILNPHKQRSKYILIPESVVEVGIHFIWVFLPRHDHCYVSPKDAILHHYRVCDPYVDCDNSSTTIDRTAWKYKNILSTHVNDVYKELKSICLLPEL